MSLLGVIGRLKTGTYTVTRTAAGTYTAGRHVAGGTSTFSITAVIQPTGTQPAEPLADGLRVEDVVVLYTATELIAVSPSNVPDTIAIGSETFAVSEVDGPWTLRGVTHWRVTATRQRLP